MLSVYVEDWGLLGCYLIAGLFIPEIFEELILFFLNTRGALQ
jgi:hypothetical protein